MKLTLELDVTQNTELTTLICNSTNISKLDVTKNTKLKLLKCIANKIS